MKVFYKTRSNAYVNLTAVTSINVVKDKIVFNMCFPFEDREKGIMSYFFYLDPDENEWMDYDYFKENFFGITGTDRNVFLNKNLISYIKAETRKSKMPKIVVCFKHSIIKKSNGAEFLAPEFMYIAQNPNVDLNAKIEKLIWEMEK